MKCYDDLAGLHWGGSRHTRTSILLKKVANFLVNVQTVQGFISRKLELVLLEKITTRKHSIQSVRKGRIEIMIAIASKYYEM